MESAERVLADYQKHYFGEKWVECKQSYPKDLTDVSDQDNKKATNSKSNNQYSSLFNSNDDYAQMRSDEDKYGAYNEQNQYNMPQEHQSRFSSEINTVGDHPGIYSMEPQGHHTYAYPYQYAYPSGPTMGYQYTPQDYAYPSELMYRGQPPMGANPKQEVYRNLNNEISHQPLNTKLKSGSHAVGSAHSEIHLLANSEDGMRRMFPLSRGYSNYMNDFTQQKVQQTVVPPKRVLNRIGTFEFAYHNDDSPTGEKAPEPRPDYNQNRFMYQNMKSSSLHPEDFQRMEYRAAHLSPSRIKVAPNTDLSHMNRYLTLNGQAGYEGNSSKQQSKPSNAEEAKPKKKDAGH
jgi:hypothetical protein